VPGNAKYYADGESIEKATKQFTEKRYRHMEPE
jgi:hypothetical protein